MTKEEKIILKAIMRGIANAYQKTEKEIESGKMAKDFIDKKGLDDRSVISIFDIGK